MGDAGGEKEEKRERRAQRKKKRQGGVWREKERERNYDERL